MTRPRAWLLALIANALILIGALLLVFTVQPAASAMRVGEVATATVVAERRVPYTDHAATVARQRQAMQAVANTYRSDPSRALRSRAEAATFLAKAAGVVSQPLPLPQRADAIRRLLPAGVDSDNLQTFPTMSPKDLRVVAPKSLSLLQQAASSRFNSNQQQTTEIALLSTLGPSVSVPQRRAIGEILAMFMSPTYVVDRQKTNALRQAAAKRVAPVRGTVYAGEVIVRRGDLVTSSVMDKLKAIGFQNRTSGWQNAAASLIFSALVVGLLFWYLHAFQNQVIMNARLVLLIDACILATAAGARILSAGHVLLPYFLPVAAGSTFAAVLLAPEACVAVTLAMAVLAGWVVANSFELTMYYFLTGSAGVLAIRHVHRVKQFILAGVCISVFAFLSALAFGIIDQNYDLNAVQDFVVAAAFNGLVSSTLALGGFALLSGFFGVTTTLQLLELGHPNQVLLRRLMTRAPGTHNHSLIVATMVERAADDVGANALVAKVGALYHDVGKTINPHCFGENQMGIGNIHDELTPAESARIIRGHVPQGLRLARQYKLPRVVLEAIAEHHGTMSISYFLHKARQEGSLHDPSLYRYPGPKPQTKETALLMLADGCESTVRAAQDHSREGIDTIVHRIFNERMESGQLDECPLTLRDIERARSAFVSVLNGLYHPRIEYPDVSEPTLVRREVEHAEPA